LKTSRLISKDLVDYFVPFLPLERRHVMECFKDYLQKNFNNYTPEQLQSLMDKIDVNTFNCIICEFRIIIPIFASIFQRAIQFLHHMEIWMQTSGTKSRCYDPEHSAEPL
jgi:hypothetical protein